MDPFKGGKVLGEAFGSGGTPGEYEKQTRRVFEAESAEQVARRNRSLALIDAARQEARGKVNTDLLARAYSGDLTAQAELGASVLGGNQTMSLGQLGDFQQPRFGEASNIQFESLLGDTPDTSRANRAAAYVKGREYQPIRAEGGAYIADGATLGDIEMVPTLPTLTSLQKAEAKIQQDQQRTNAAVAKAGRAPASSGGGGKPKGGAITQAQYKALPSGTQFVAPDGTVRVKP